MEGYVYVLSNPSMPGIYKIGVTARPIVSRICELSNATGVPTPFKEEFSLYTLDMYEAENILHKSLSKYRVNKDREFFKVDLETIHNATRLLYEKHCSTLDKYKDTIQFTGKNYFAHHLQYLFNNSKNDIITRNFKFEDCFSDIFYKDGAYYKIELATQVCDETELLNWKNKIIKSEKLIRFHNTYVKIAKLNKKYIRVNPIAA